MGKLHTLRRAIQRDPEAWFHDFAYNRERYAKCAWRSKRGGSYNFSGYAGDTRRGSYRSFVKHVLAQMGIYVR